MSIEIKKKSYQFLALTNMFVMVVWPFACIAVFESLLVERPRQGPTFYLTIVAVAGMIFFGFVSLIADEQYQKLSKQEKGETK